MLPIRRGADVLDSYKACQMVLQTRDLSEVQARFTFAPAPT